MLADTLRAVSPVSESARAAAEARQARLTKPPGSLGLLETVGNRLAAIADHCPPPSPSPAVVGVFAGDHGVVANGVTPWPQEITGQMIANMASGGAAISVLARQVGARVVLTDVGSVSQAPPSALVRDRRVRRGTRDLLREAAMTRDEAVAAVEVGIATALEEIDAGARLLATGEMGIGNTTPAAALISVFTGLSPTLVTGAGAGADGAMVAHKTYVIEEAIALHAPEVTDPIGVLAALGGLEHAAIAGFILGAASRRIPVVLDGVIACSAACVAVALSPDAAGYLLAGHAGAEPGIRAALEHLGLTPLVDLGLRLGEGTGAALAIPFVQAAARLLAEMATFDDLGRPARGCTALVLGGARSGKSTWAEARFADRGVVDYVATSRNHGDDQEWADRVAAHRARRPTTWRTHETLDLPAVLLADDDAPVIIDCLAVWLTRVLDEAGAWEGADGWRGQAEVRIDALVESLLNTRREVVLVSNEVGQGIVPDSASGRLFRDELGRLNARLASVCSEAWCCEAGIPRRLK